VANDIRCQHDSVLVHAFRRVSRHEADVWLCPTVVGIVQCWVCVTRLTDGQDVAYVSLPALHPHVTAHQLGIAVSAVSTRLLGEVAARTFGPVLCFTSTIVTGADDVAHFKLTSK